CETVTRDGSGGVIEPAYWTGLSIASCENVVFENMYIHHFGRDGIDLAQSGIGFWQTGSFSRYNSNNILVKNCNIEYNGRQAYSNT
ncbi:hypothetical protein, partial [Exiguobacterium indicum]|uniref:hypothetical protein n=1 Tax=Exiguobacterium indicum TaxID=296995 RepID=UPI002B263204